MLPGAEGLGLPDAGKVTNCLVSLDQHPRNGAGRHMDILVGLVRHLNDLHGRADFCSLASDGLESFSVASLRNLLFVFFVCIH